MIFFLRDTEDGVLKSFPISFYTHIYIFRLSVLVHERSKRRQTANNVVDRYGQRANGAEEEEKRHVVSVNVNANQNLLHG